MKTIATLTFACLLLHAGGSLASPAYAASNVLSPRHARLEQRDDEQECGQGIGSCDPGQCCSEGGYCGTGPDYCGGSDCQLDYSDSCDTFKGPPGSSTANVPRPKIGSVPYGSIITTCKTAGNMALTFDDGPYTYTSQILDILDSYGVKATFFVAGNNRGKGRIDDASLPWPGLLRRMYQAGHHIASHTWTHRNLNEVNSTIQRTEMIYNEMAFRNLFGWFPTYMRPPYLECGAGSGCLSLMNKLGYHVITVNVDTKDYENDDPSLIQISKDRFSSGVSTNAANNQYIVLAHDVHYQTVVNLTAYMINTTRQRGYKLVTVGECLGDPRINWYRSASGGGALPSGSLPPIPPATLATTGGSSKTTTKTTSYATPSSTIKSSPDQSCGGTTGYTCQGSSFGSCCSYYGFCGSSDAYCGTGCDPNFGTCTPKSSGNTSVTTNGLCGTQYGSTCKNFGTKTCCSQFGYCGSTDQYCGSGCQKNYGTCT